MNLNIGRTLMRCLVFVVAGSSWVCASITTAQPDWMAWVEWHRLYEQDEWHKILYYESARGGVRSQADDPAFFLAGEGASDPKSELIASIEQFLTEPSGDENPVHCRFPRRYDWLKSRLPKTLSWPDVKCPELSAFIEQAAPKGMTLVYPASYLNNPASMFGHTFIRVDAEEGGEQRNDLLALTVSYGADVKPNENGFVYAFKGLTGLYPGSVRSHPYYLQVQNYNELESRDIWEYRLRLTADQTETFIKAAWELKDINFHYAYLLKNCSYRLLSVMEAAFPELDLVSEYDAYAVPIDTLRTLERAGLLDEPHYRPAIASRIAYLRRRLPSSGNELARRLVDDGVSDNRQQALADYSQDQQGNIIDLAYEYSRFKAKRDEGDLAEVSYDLLRLRSRYPSGELKIEPDDWPTEPLAGHGIRRIGLGGGVWRDNPYGLFSFRPVYHDRYDRQAGFLEHSQINALNSEWRLVSDSDSPLEIKLDRFDLVDFSSLVPYNPMTPAMAWTGRLGWQRSSPDDTQLPFGMSLGLGRSRQLTDNSSVFLMALFEASSRPELSYGIHAGWLASLGHDRRLGAEVRSTDSVLTDDSRLLFDVTYNHPLSRNQAVRTRIGYRNGDATEGWEARLQYLRYF